MGKVRFIICIVFVISCVIFGGYIVKVKMVEDNTPPEIFCDAEEITISVKDKESVLLKGITAKDNRDGDITESVRVSSVSHFVKGKRTVTYIVFDKANNVGMLERTVRYSDYKAPRIYMEKPLRFIASSAYNLKFDGYYSAQDVLDGDITNQVRTIFDDSFYDLMEGTCGVTLQVNNSAGDVCSIPMELQVYSSGNDDERLKEYPMLKEYIVYTGVNREVNLEENVIGIVRNGTEYRFAEVVTPSAGDIRIDSKVDYSTPGVYVVEYSYKAEGASRAVTNMYVVVEGKDSAES